MHDSEREVDVLSGFSILAENISAEFATLLFS